jgi:hypothetical protein
MTLLSIVIVVAIGENYPYAQTPSSANNLQQMNKNGRLTLPEEAIIRNIVYTKGLATCFQLEGPWAGHRIVDLPGRLVELHKKNPLGTLTLLLEIVKGASPKDALTAACFAIALEEDPFAAVICADFGSDAIDLEDANNESTFRIRLANSITKMISKNGKKK